MNIQRRLSLPTLALLASMQFVLVNGMYSSLAQGTSRTNMPLPPPVLAGFIEVKREPVYYRKFEATRQTHLPTKFHEELTKVQEKLTKAQDYQSLYAGDQIKCGRGGFAIFIGPGDGPKTNFVATTWQTVLQPPTHDSRKIGAILKRIVEPFVTITRRSVHFFVWPANNSSVPPDIFTIRWSPVPKRLSFTLFADDTKNTLASVSGINGSLGKLNWLEGGSRLKSWQDQGNSGEVKLSMSEVGQNVGTSDIGNSVLFSLMSKSEANILNSELNQCDEPSPLMRHLAKGEVYIDHGLLSDAADEYAAALRIVPASSLLRRDTAALYRLTNDERDAESLEK